MKTCQSMIYSDASFRTQLGEECGAPAEWVFSYNYAEKECDCRDRNCPVYSPPMVGETFLCGEHRGKSGRNSDNLVPEEDRWRKI